jgi:nucleoside-diphosphate-sugar epimerase
MTGRGIARCLVIGGAGMLGWEIVRQLAARGVKVRVLDLAAPEHRPGEPDPGSLCEARAGDIRSPSDVEAACAGMDAVIQTAAAVWNVRTPARTYHEVNVEGNRNVLEACRKAGISRLLYTSTLDVVVDGRTPIVDGDESLPYPRRLPKDPYSLTKIRAEQMMLAANGPELATCALRPVGMYGPRDKYHLGNFVAMAKKGVSIRLGDGSAHFSHVYSENAAWAHVLAAMSLYPGSATAGQSYFVCDHYPAANLFDFIAPFLRALDLPAATRSIPYGIAYPMAAVAELLAPHSNFNRFAVIQTCVDHTFVHARASRDFGYEPIVSQEEAFRRTVAWLKEKEAAAGQPQPDGARRGASASRR